MPTVPCGIRTGMSVYAGSPASGRRGLERWTLRTPNRVQAQVVATEVTAYVPGNVLTTWWEMAAGSAGPLLGPVRIRTT